MADIKSPTERYKAIADAIREKNGTTELMHPADMPQAILDISSGGGTEEIEDLIDNSGVLEDTEGTVTEKVGELIDKVAYELKSFECITNAGALFQGAKSFPTKAIVNLPNATSTFRAFSSWRKDSIPMVEEITLYAPNVITTSMNNCMGNTFYANACVRKVIVITTDACGYLSNTFNFANNLEEVVLNFSTKNIVNYGYCFNECFKLKKIVAVFDFSSATGVAGIFTSCINLEEVTFEPNTLSISISLAQSSKLTAESVQSIIDGLKIVETAQTLNLNKAIVLTDEQKATINAKGWTLAQ